MSTNRNVPGHSYFHILAIEKAGPNDQGAGFKIVILSLFRRDLVVFSREFLDLRQKIIVRMASPQSVIGADVPSDDFRFHPLVVLRPHPQFNQLVAVT